MLENLDEIPLFNPAAALSAQLRSGYKSTDYAISEIIDNSIEAKAQNVDLFIVQGWSEPTSTNGRRSKIIKNIVIVDDGCGFDPAILNNALAFGYGTHLANTENIIDGFGKLGKFGYGLPNSSVATANDIHIWSWRSDIDDAYYTNLNVKAILDQRETRQSTVTKKKVHPKILKMIQAAGSRFGECGTIVDWEDTVRCSWARSSVLTEHIEETVGRIFRKYLNNDRVIIRTFIFEESDLNKATKSLKVRPNDPLFLMKNSLAHSLLEPNDRDPNKELFEKHKFAHSGRKPGAFYWSDDGNVYKIAVDIGEREAIVTLSFGVTTEFLRKKPYGGRSAIGRLVRSNSGVSICRSGRELSLSVAWIPSQDALERWWGAEIDFPPALDDYFGVTNNKQTAMTLDEFANVDMSPDSSYVNDYNEDNNLTGSDACSDYFDVVEDMRANGDKRWVSLLIRYLIYRESRAMYSKIKRYGKSDEKPADKTQPDVPVKKTSNEKAAQVVSEENPTTSDTANVTAEDFDDEGATEKDKLDVLQWIESKESVLIQNRVLNSNDLFQYQQKEGKILIIFNTSHPGYDMLFGNIEDMVLRMKPDSESGELSKEQLAERLDDVRTSLALFISSLVTTEALKMDTHDLRLLRRYRSRFSEEFDGFVTRFKRELDEEGGYGEEKVFN